MKVAIFGLGYVGSVSAACLASVGHEVIGVDVDEHKLSMIRQGRSPINEPGLDALLGQMVTEGRLRSPATPMRLSPRRRRVSLLCVGTPSRRNGSLEYGLPRARRSQQIGAALAGRTAYHVVAVRSTLLPGVLTSRLIPLLEQASGRAVGRRFGVCVNPEFLREGSAIADFEKPPFTVIGESDRQGRRRAARRLRAPAGAGAPRAPRRSVDGEVREQQLPRAEGGLRQRDRRHLPDSSTIDGQQVMRVFCEDQRAEHLAALPAPGFRVRRLVPAEGPARDRLRRQGSRSSTTPLLNSVLASNDAHIQRVVDIGARQAPRAAWRCSA